MSARPLRVRSAVDYTANGLSAASSVPAWMRSSMASSQDEVTDIGKENTASHSVKDRSDAPSKNRKSAPAGGSGLAPPGIPEAPSASESRKGKRKPSKSLGGKASSAKRRTAEESEGLAADHAPSGASERVAGALASRSVESRAAAGGGRGGAATGEAARPTAAAVSPATEVDETARPAKGLAARPPLATPAGEAGISPTGPREEAWGSETEDDSPAPLSRPARAAPRGAARMADRPFERVAERAPQAAAVAALAAEDGSGIPGTPELLPEELVAHFSASFSALQGDYLSLRAQYDELKAAKIGEEVAAQLEAHARTVEENGAAAAELVEHWKVEAERLAAELEAVRGAAGAGEVGEGEAREGVDTDADGAAAAPSRLPLLCERLSEAVAARLAAEDEAARLAERVEELEVRCAFLERHARVPVQVDRCLQTGGPESQGVDAAAQAPNDNARPRADREARALAPESATARSAPDAGAASAGGDSDAAGAPRPTPAGPDPTPVGLPGSDSASAPRPAPSAGNEWTHEPEGSQQPALAEGGDDPRGAERDRAPSPAPTRAPARASPPASALAPAARRPARHCLAPGSLLVGLAARIAPAANGGSGGTAESAVHPQSRNGLTARAVSEMGAVPPPAHDPRRESFGEAATPAPRRLGPRQDLEEGGGGGASHPAGGGAALRADDQPGAATPLGTARGWGATPRGRGERAPEAQGADAAVPLPEATTPAGPSGGILGSATRQQRLEAPHSATGSRISARRMSAPVMATGHAAPSSSRRASVGPCAAERDGPVPRALSTVREESTPASAAGSLQAALLALTGLDAARGSREGSFRYYHAATGYAFEIAPAEEDDEDGGTPGAASRATGADPELDLAYEPLELGVAAGLLAPHLRGRILFSGAQRELLLRSIMAALGAAAPLPPRRTAAARP